VPFIMSNFYPVLSLSTEVAGITPFLSVQTPLLHLIRLKSSSCFKSAFLKLSLIFALRMLFERVCINSNDIFHVGQCNRERLTVINSLSLNFELSKIMVTYQTIHNLILNKKGLLLQTCWEQFAFKVDKWALFNSL